MQVTMFFPAIDNAKLFLDMLGLLWKPDPLIGQATRSDRGN